MGNFSNKSVVTVAMAEDNKYFCLTVEKVISEQENIKFLGYANSVEGFKQLIEKQVPDIALLDLELTNPKDGIELLRWLNDKHESVKSIIMTVNEDEISDCYMLGAMGYILKSNLDNFGDIIKDVHNGKVIIPPTVGKLFIDQIKVKSTQDKLRLEIKQMSERELEILRMLKKNFSRQEIANKLCISIFTIKRHVENILKKNSSKTMKEVLNKFDEVL